MGCVYCLVFIFITSEEPSDLHYCDSSYWMKIERIKNEWFAPLLSFLLYPILLTSSSSCSPCESWERRTEGGAGGKREAKKGRESKHGSEEWERVDVKTDGRDLKEGGESRCWVSNVGLLSGSALFFIIDTNCDLESGASRHSRHTGPKERARDFCYFFPLFLN